jgi:DNA polymerase elongation subunit (family B)
MNNLLFLNSFYVKEKIGKDENGKWQTLKPDFILYTEKNVDNNDTYLHIIPEPKFHYYIVKPEFRSKYTVPRLSAPIDELIAKTVPYNKRIWSFVEDLNLKDQYLQAIRYKMSPEEKYNSLLNPRENFEQYNIKNNPYLYCVDIDIEDYFKTNHMETNGRNLLQDKLILRKSFMDIENDLYNYKGSQPTGQNPTCPTNLITYFDEFTNTLHTFILDYYKEIDIRSQINNIKDNESIYNEELFKEADMRFNSVLYWCNTEEELYLKFWSLIHKLKPDFCGIWNMNYDIPTILGRMYKLNMNVVDIVTHPDVPNEFKYVYYKEDPKRKKKIILGSDSPDTTPPHRFWDKCNISGYTQFYDQMSLYSNIRKRFMLPSYKLDDIAEEEIKKKKVDYHELGYNIRNLAHKNFKLFLLYGQIDTIRLKQIEDKNNDLNKQLLFAGNTSFLKSLSISYTIKNQMMLQYKDKNEVIGNNVLYDTPYEKLDGAIVANNKTLKLRGKYYINGQILPTLIFKNVTDYDFSSLYPSVMCNFNINKDTIDGRIIEININGESKYKGKECHDFANKLMTLDSSLLDLCEKYLDLPNILELIQTLEKEMEKQSKNI